jgi:hypothetical protein
MKVSGIYLAIMICAVLLISGVSAQNVDNPVRYTVTPATNLTLPDIIRPMTQSTITQSQINLYSTYISPGTSSLTTDLNWGNPSNSLSLTIIAPDETLGPYYDASDGTLNGRIDLMVTNPGGSLTPGTWEFEVYGNHVQGPQIYNFLTY